MESRGWNLKKSNRIRAKGSFISFPNLHGMMASRWQWNLDKCSWEIMQGGGGYFPHSSLLSFLLPFLMSGCFENSWPETKIRACVLTPATTPDQSRKTWPSCRFFIGTFLHNYVAQCQSTTLLWYSKASNSIGKIYSFLQIFFLKYHSLNVDLCGSAQISKILSF